MPPGRTDGQRDPADDEADDDDGHRHPGGGSAVVRLVDVRQAGLHVQRVRSGGARGLRHGARCRFVGHLLLPSPLVTRPIIHCEVRD